LQFLSAALDPAPSCADWRQLGYLSGIYVEAFETFLSLSGSGWPNDFYDPILGLFLLICDLAINPTRGFPLDIESFEDFIEDVDVGVRFLRLSLIVKDLPHLKTSIRAYSREEYAEVSAQLTNATGYDHPFEALEAVASWITRAPGLERLMAERANFEFSLENLPVRVFLSHYVWFAKDKLEHPEFFCWAGAWMAGDRANEQAKALWLRHLSLFGDRGDKPGVYPRRRPGCEERVVKATFESFYGAVALYDLTRQWILLDGPFVCDLEWLAENYSQDRTNEWANEVFKQTYGVRLDQFDLID
jgi:hypothetical protein